MIDVLRILVAPLVWLAAFSGIYGLHGLACSEHSDLLGAMGLQAPALLIGAWVTASLVQVTILIGLHRNPSPSPFVSWVSVQLGWTAVIAALWSLFPVLLLGCA